MLTTKEKYFIIAVIFTIAGFALGIALSNLVIFPWRFGEQKKHYEYQDAEIVKINNWNKNMEELEKTLKHIFENSALYIAWNDLANQASKDNEKTGGK